MTMTRSARHLWLACLGLAKDGKVAHEEEGLRRCGSEHDPFTSSCLSARGLRVQHAEGKQEEDGSEERSPSTALSRLENHEDLFFSSRCFRL